MKGVKYVNIGITNVWRIRDDRRFILVVLAGRRIFRMVVGRAFWGNDDGGRFYDLDSGEYGNVSFGNIYSGSGRTKGEF